MGRNQITMEPPKCKDGYMAHKHAVVDDLLHRLFTTRSRSAVTLAAVSFAICHCAVIASTPGPGGLSADFDVEIPRQLIHFAAAICRFVLPLGFMAAGFSTRLKPPARSDLPEK
jgi:hypothetical protein